MKVVLYYFHLLQLGENSGRVRTVEEFTQAAQRFADTYRRFPPEADHTLKVIFLRGQIQEADRLIWSGIDCTFAHYQPKEFDGYSTQAMQEQARSETADFIVAMCSRVYFHRRGWLRRMVEARQRHGDTLYGSMFSLLGCPLQTHPYPNPHFRGSLLAVDTRTFNLYPYQVRSASDEYRFECGEWNLTTWYAMTGHVPMLVTFDGEYGPDRWLEPKNTFCNGDQSNLLNWDRHTEAYARGINVPP